MRTSLHSVLSTRWLGAATLLLSFSSFGVSSTPSLGTWYTGAKLGLVNATGSCESHASHCDKDFAAGELFVGYRLHDWLSLETGYGYLGDIHAIYPALGDPTQPASYKGEMYGLALSAKSYWQINDEWAVFGKVGGLRWSMAVTGNEIGFTHKANDSGWSPILGTGVEYSFNRNWSTALEYLWVNNVGGNQTGGTDLSVINLGVTYHFGLAMPLLPTSAETAVSSGSETLSVYDSAL
ncbi:MAG: outer membrane beta-barrel protein [Plesiomonas sp.]